MKIIYIANVRMPTERAHGGQIMKMCEAWGKEHQVILYYPFRINYIKKDPFDFYGIKKNFKLKKIFSLDLLPWEKFFSKSVFYFQNISFAFFSFLNLFFKKADIFFARDFWSAFFLSLAGKKVIYEIHDSPNRHFITKLAFRKIDKFVTTNKYKAEELMNKFGVQQKNILALPNGVDIEDFDILESKEECRKKLELPVNKQIVLYTGHLFSWKGADVLLEASKNLSKDILTIFVGGTPQDLIRFRAKAGLSDKVLILGHKEHKEIPYYLKASDVLVLPNTAKERISLKETSPLKLFEYMASKRPIIASKIPSIEEVVSENEVVFFEPDNPEELKDKILEVLENYSDFEYIAERAFLKVQNYTWENRANSILKFATNTGSII